MLHLQRQTLPGQFGLKEARMTCKTLFALSFLGLLCVVAYGGAIGGSAPLPSLPSRRSASLTALRAFSSAIVERRLRLPTHVDLLV